VVVIGYFIWKWYNKKNIDDDDDDFEDDLQFNRQFRPEQAIPYYKGNIQQRPMMPNIPNLPNDIAQPNQPTKPLNDKQFESQINKAVSKDILIQDMNQ